MESAKGNQGKSRDIAWYTMGFNCELKELSSSSSYIELQQLQDF